MTSRLMEGNKTGGASFCVLPAMVPKVHCHPSMRPVLVLVTVSASSGHISAGMSKPAITSLSSIMVAVCVSEQTPLDTVSDTSLTEDAGQITWCWRVLTLVLLKLQFHTFTSCAPLCENN